MVQAWKELIIYYLKILHSTKSKKDLIIGFTISKQLESTLFHLFICSHTPGTNFQVTLQQWQNHGSSSSKTLIIYCLMIFPSTKSKIDLIIRFTTTKQLENSFFHQFIFSPTLETNFQQLYSSDKIMVLVWKTLIIYCLKMFQSTKSKIDLIIGSTTSKQLETTLFQ